MVHVSVVAVAVTRANTGDYVNVSMYEVNTTVIALL